LAEIPLYIRPTFFSPSFFLKKQKRYAALQRVQKPVSIAFQKKVNIIKKGKIYR